MQVRNQSHFVLHSPPYYYVMHHPWINLGNPVVFLTAIIWWKSYSHFYAIQQADSHYMGRRYYDSLSPFHPSCPLSFFPSLSGEHKRWVSTGDEGTMGTPTSSLPSEHGNCAELSSRRTWWLWRWLLSHCWDPSTQFPQCMPWSKTHYLTSRLIMKWNILFKDHEKSQGGNVMAFH